MRIRGAVLRDMGLDRPYADSRPLTIEDLDLDAPGPGEVLIRLTAAGVCHSDLSVVDGNRPRPLPMLLGHEGAGIVEALGEGVDDLRLGEQVVTVFLPRCGVCRNCLTDGKLPCIPGSATNSAGTLPFDGHKVRLHDDSGAEVLHHLGASVFATHAVVNRASVVPVGDDVPPGIAAVLGCAVLTGGGAVLNAGAPGPEDEVMIVGLGGVGMAALITALSVETAGVIGVDANPDKLAFAEELGAIETYTPEELGDRRAPIVIECVGHPRAFETAFTATAVGGTTVTVGLPSPEARASIAPVTLTAEARTVIGSYLGSAVPSRDIPVYAQAWREGRLPVEALISDTVGLDDINAAFDALAEGRVIRQVIDFTR
ncbi:alcohol dehydrogenase catalytic domain-containing protein [Brevibacterium ammoniilyticum]|uniref:Alcohol dehydrogenase catalytic domain-containing protein n=1 Tax=Brevibacterium ammoniilyticum TaxID=1046555 RepID=A0ABP9U8A5_9MICO